MPPKNPKPGQQLSKATAQNSTTSTATTNPSHDANEDHDAANANEPSNSIILTAICSIREDLTKQSADMLEAVNGTKGELLSHSRRIGEAEERISQAEEDVGALQQKVKQLEETAKILSNKIQD